MKTYKKIVESNKLIITYDNDMESPRTFTDTNIGYFITCDSKMKSPDNNETLKAVIEQTADMAKDQAEHIALIKKEYTAEKVIAVYPVVKYEHGNVSYRLVEAHGFDYSNNGFYVVTEESKKRSGVLSADVSEFIKDELKTYTQWVNGEIYAFELLDDNGDYEDSCGGFYDIEDIRENLPEEYKDENLNNYLI
jgi:hypothetical protein